MIHKLLKALTKSHTFVRTGFERTDQWKKLQVDDIVEYAIQFPDGIKYRITEIDHEKEQARIVRLNEANEPTSESYTVARVMLRPVG